MYRDNGPTSLSTVEDAPGIVGQTPEQRAAWMRAIQARLDAGEHVSPDELGLDMIIDHGRVRDKTWWERNRRNLLEAGLVMAAGMTGGALLGGTGGALLGGTGAAGAGAAGAGGAGGGAASLVPSTLGGFTTPGVGAVATSPGASTLVPSTLGGFTTPGVGSVATSAALGANGGAASQGGLLATLGRYSDRITNVGDVLSSAASANASGRRADSLADMNAATANNRARVDVGQFNIDAPNERAKQVARGDLMSANIPDSQVSGSGRNVSFSGGLRPSLFSQATTDAGEALKRQSLDALLNNRDHIDPQIVQPRRAGAGENLAGGLGLGLNLLGLLGGGKRGTNGAR